MLRKNRIALAVIFSASFLSGCAPLLIGSATVAGASVAADRRSSGAVANDNVIEAKAAMHLSQASFPSSHITVTSYEGNVLLSGEIGTAEEKEKATEIAKSVNEVNRVYNELAVMKSVSFTTRMNDSITASKIRAALLDNPKVTITAVKVVVDRGIAYLLGSVTEAEGQAIAKIASKVKGVSKVVTLFNYITKEDVKKRAIFEDSKSSPASGSGKKEGASPASEGEWNGNTQAQPVKL